MILIDWCCNSLLAHTQVAPELQVHPGFKTWLAGWQKSISSQPSFITQDQNQSTNLHPAETPTTPFSSIQGSEDHWKAPPTSHAYGWGSGTTVAHLISSAQLYKESASQHRLGASDHPITLATGGSSFSTPKATFGHASVAQQKHFSWIQAKPTPKKLIMLHVSTFSISDGVCSRVFPSN